MLANAESLSGSNESYFLFCIFYLASILQPVLGSFTSILQPVLGIWQASKHFTASAWAVFHQLHKRLIYIRTNHARPQVRRKRCLFVLIWHLKPIYQCTSQGNDRHMCEALYKDPSSTPPIPQAVFIELMESATSSVEFSFNDTMYKQTDGVAMGSPLGPALANNFVGYHESKTILLCSKTDNLFSICWRHLCHLQQEGDVDNFLVTLNCLHPALKFTLKRTRWQTSISRHFSGKNWTWFRDQCISKTHFFWSIHPLGILQPTQTENEPNRHAGTQSTYDMYKKQA